MVVFVTAPSPSRLFTGEVHSANRLCGLRDYVNMQQMFTSAMVAKTTVLENAPDTVDSQRAAPDVEESTGEAGSANDNDDDDEDDEDETEEDEDETAESPAEDVPLNLTPEQEGWVLFSPFMR